MHPPIRQRTVRERHIRKPCRSDIELTRIRHDQVFQYPLTCTHDIYRIRSLIRTHAEEMTRLVHHHQVHQLLCLDVIVLYQRLHRVFISLRTHMLVCREVRHNVKSLLLTEYSLEYRTRKIQGVRPVILRHLNICTAPQVTRQLSQSVLIQIHHDQLLRFKPQQCLDERRPN